MNMRFTYFILATSIIQSFAVTANQYNDWAQKNAVNLMCDINPICSMSKVLIPSKERISKMTTAINRDSKALSRPNVGLISANEISNYPYVDRYLNEQLGDKNDITHYYILSEDYTFQDLSGESITIPAGFIWDGASIPSHRSATWKKPLESARNGLIELGLEVGNTRYSSALAEGLIHDYMYRDPRRFSKEDADDLLYVNLVRCGNANPLAIYEGVHVAGWDSYLGHKKRQDQGLYDDFTGEFYKKNAAIYQSRRTSHQPAVFDRDSQQNASNNNSQQPDLHSLNLDDPNGDWCKCDPPGCKDETKGLIRYVQCQCAKCGKINVGYARRALAMEKEIKAQGGQTQWLGNRSDAVKAANTQK